MVPALIHSQVQKNSLELSDLKINSEEIDFFLVFDQPDLSYIPIASSKKEKGRKVYYALKHNAENTQRRVISFLQRRNIPYRSFYLVNTILVKSDPEIVRTLSGYSEVKKMVPHSNFVMKPQPIESSEYFGRTAPVSTWGLEVIRADDVWDLGIKGQGVVVGGHDTGVDWHHPSLINRYRGWNGNNVDHHHNWFDAIYEINRLHQDSIIQAMNNPCGLQSPYPCDDDLLHSHGTHTMGTMVGYDPELNLHIGVAPEAEWIAVRNMERGYGTPYTYLMGFEWFLAPTDLEGNNPDPDLAPDVINNSWACPPFEGCNKENFYLIETAIENLRKAGIVVVVSAGNQGRSGCSTITNPPAIFESSFTVGSVDANDSLSDFSSRGPVIIDSSYRIKPNVTAPGRGVLSAQQDDKYGYLTGTSMAGPHVAGVVALIISANPNLKGQVATIESIIEKSAVSKTEANTCSPTSRGSTQNALYGFGRIDAFEAVMMARALTTSSEKEVINGDLICSPNPAINKLLISWPSNSKIKDICLLDWAGQILECFYVKNESYLEMDVVEIPSGSYIILAKGDYHFYSEKFIVQH
jgi:serine protease AprX